MRKVGRCYGLQPDDELNCWRKDWIAKVSNKHRYNSKNNDFITRMALSNARYSKGGLAITVMPFGGIKNRNPKWMGVVLIKIWGLEGEPKIFWSNFCWLNLVGDAIQNKTDYFLPSFGVENFLTDFTFVTLKTLIVHHLVCPGKRELCNHWRKIPKKKRIQIKGKIAVSSSFKFMTKAKFIER